MKVPKQISRKTALISIIVSILITSSIFYAFGATPSSTFYISSGIYPGAPSYTVWNEGSNYFAKDANGLIAYSGTNASDIIQSALNDGAKTLIEPGTYTLSATLILNAGNSLVGTNRASTSLTGAINPLIQWTGKNYVEVRGLTLDGVDRTGVGISVLGTYPAIKSGFNILEDLQIVNCEKGMNLNCLTESKIQNIRMVYCDYGILFENACINVFISELDFISLRLWGIVVTSTTQRCEGLQFDKSILWNCSGSLWIKSGLFIAFDEVLFDYGGTSYHVQIEGGDTIMFSKCYFASASATDGIVQVKPLIGEIVRVTFDNCMFDGHKYYGLGIVYDPVSGRRPNCTIVTSCVFLHNGLVADGGDIIIDNADKVRIIDCELLSTIPPKNLVESNSPTDIWVIRNTIAKGSAGLTIVPGITEWHQNLGFVTEARGNATILNGQSTVAVAHTLANYPTIVTLGATHAEVADAIWVNVNAAQFNVTTAAPVTGDRVVTWYAEYKP